MDLDEAIEQARQAPAAYVVSPQDSSYLYKGSARNLRERLKDHRAGRVSRTKKHRPLIVVYIEYCATYTDARKRENFLKSGQGRVWLKDYLDSGQTVPP